MKDDVTISYSFTYKNEQVTFRNLNELRNPEHLLALKKKLIDFERKMKITSAHHLLQEKLTSQQFEQINIELKDTRIESIPT